MRFFRKNPLHRFRCRVCGNTFSKEATLAVCNGVNVKADEEGRPLDAEGHVLPNGAALVLDRAEEHRPVQMEVAS